MAKIIEICDVNSEGHRVRASDGTYRTIPHGARESLSIGDELDPPPASTPVEYLPLVDCPNVVPPVDFLNSDAQVAANILSEKLKEFPDDKPEEPEAKPLKQAKK